MDTFRFMWLLSIWILKSTSSLSQLYHNISNRRGIPVKLFRKYEHLTYKLSKKNLDKVFFNTCLDLQICPEFLKFKAPRLKAYESTNVLYQQVVRQQLDVVEDEIASATEKWKDTRIKLFDKLSFLERRCVMKLLQNVLDRKVTNDEERINKKLERTWSRNKLSSPDCLINLSCKKLNVYEKNALYLGLNHHILPKKICGNEVQVQIEKTMKSLVRHQGKPLDYDTKEHIKNEVHSFLKNARAVCSSRSNTSLHNVLTNLAKDDSIAICKFDKGNGVVILDKDDYNSKCLDILSDTSKFQKLKYENVATTILKKRKSLQNYVYRYLRNNDSIEKSTYDTLYDVGSSPGKFYGLVKVHKDGYPIRPVVSMINTPEYGIAKWLDTFIKPNIPSKYMLSSTDNFINVIKDFPVYPGDKLVSFDVKSLYTNVPLHETVKIVADYVYSKNAVCTPPITKTIFTKLLLLVTQGNFIFNGEFYKQTDGLAMGGPLGPSLANFFLADLEKKKMFNTGDIKSDPKLYLRYIDDIFALFDEYQSYCNFFKRINMLHSNLEFTVETATDTLPFLDVSVKLQDDSVDLCIYRKKTNTNVLMNFNAVAPTQWKVGLILCLLNRAWKICTSTELFSNEVIKIKQIFVENGYPVSFLNRVCEKFHNNLYNTTDNSEVSDHEEPNIVLKLPFINKPSKVFAKRMKNLILKKFNVKLIILYKSCKLSTFFSLKDSTPLPLISNAVYKFSCLRDANITYIGETTRPMELRVEEHLSLSKNKTAVGKHIVQCNACASHNVSYLPISVPLILIDKSLKTLF